MSPLESYLRDLRDIRATGAGVAETSFYPALANLLNEVGKSLKPKVRCVMNLADRGAGIPDGGLFTANQFQKSGDAAPKQGQPPERGALEAKPTSEAVEKIARSKQVERYCGQYGLVLVTNFCDFLLLGRGPDGKPTALESYSLAGDEKSFWAAAAHPQKTAGLEGERFVEYLKRVMLSNAPLAAPQDVAWFLASYARDAKTRVEQHKDLSALAAVREALEEALGMRFTGEKGEHFFRSTLVQTVFYGVFSAWVLWHRQRPGRTDAFNWHEAEWSLHVPFIRTLYHQVASPERLGPLGLVEALDWAAAALSRVDRPAFFQRFQDEHAVQYFYEPFLEAFDPELRKQLGVWYTPPEIVKYQVARVDTVLREELGLADGLADPNVVVLDPCCGTAAYLVEVLAKIAETLKAKGGDALLASDLKQAAMTRVFGFEILPAPFVVSHLQLGLLLHRLGVPLSDKKAERVGVYLTNSLTGWEPPKEPKRFLFPELEAEHDAADKIKQHARILVILGNPPYNAFAGVSPEEEQGLVEPYKEGLNRPVSEGGWGIKKFNLDDLYVRFFRLAERRIAEMTGKGVVSFISNFSYLEDPSFVVMRQRFLREFDRLWFDCMNGDSRETGKLTPDGYPDPSVFSTQYNREGIRVGTTVCVIVRKQKREKKPTVRFRSLWGTAKRQHLLSSLERKRFDSAYTQARPLAENRYSFRPELVSGEYASWPRVVELCAVPPFNGPVERRGGSLISIDHDALEERIRAYFDPNVPDSEVALLHASLMMTGNRIVGPKAREKLLREHTFGTAHITRYPFKVFDFRWSYLANIRPLFSEPSPQLLSQRSADNAFFITRDTADKSPEGPPFYFSRLVCDYDCISGHARHFPLLLRNGQRLDRRSHQLLFDVLKESPNADCPVANLSQAVRAYLSSLRVKAEDAESTCSRLIWMHSLAVGYSPAYLTENADGIRRDWPRIPLPDKRKLLEESAELGRRVAGLLDTETEVPGVTAGKLDSLLQTIGVPAKIGGGQLHADAGELAVTAGWGHAGKGGVTMPAKGRVVRREYDRAERAAIAAAAQARGMAENELLSLLGPATCDVYLNDAAYWRNVPANVWDYTIGGYQVIKKWLSYREQELLGRPLRAEEAREVMNTARRLSAIMLLQPALDENYRRVKGSTYAWAVK